jgi:hypothetical protein
LHSQRRRLCNLQVRLAFSSLDLMIGFNKYS